MSFKAYLAEQEALAEAIPLDRAKEYRQAWNPNTYASLFMKTPVDRRDRRGFRIYLPYDKGEQAAPTAPYDVVRALGAKGYAVSDYAAGLAQQKDGKRVMKIGKLLADAPDVLKRFMNDPGRAAKKIVGKLVCISRHPYDVAGMSTDRGWRSCMEITDGINRRYVMQDVKAGTLVAYLIRADDMNIRNPISRLLIKPFVNQENPSDVLLATDAKQYGTSDGQFAKVVEKWLAKANGPDKTGMYCLHPRLYNDGKGAAFVGGVPDTLDAMEKWLNAHHAAPTMFKDAGNGAIVLEQWGDLETFCRYQGDDLLGYLLDLRENIRQAEEVSPATVRMALERLPDALVDRLCRRFGVPAHDRTRLARLADEREIAREMGEALGDGSGLKEMLDERIARYVEAGWRFKMDQCSLHVQRNGDGYDVDAPVQLLIQRRDMIGYIENYMEDPHDKQGGGYNDLHRIIHDDGSWSDFSEHNDLSDWRGEYSDDPLVDRRGEDEVFGSKRRPKLDVGEDGDEGRTLARRYAAFLRGETPSRIPDGTPDLFGDAG